MHDLGVVHRNRWVTPGVVLLDLAPRSILLLLLYRFPTLRTVLRDLQKEKEKKSAARTIRGGWMGRRQTYVAVLLAPIAVLDGGLRAVHVLRNGVRRSQAVPGGANE